ncbi:DUF4625 domain-containing protein [Phocaeicola sp.]
MKTKIYFPVICLLAICSVGFTSCDDDEKGDVTKPVIELLEPEEGAVLQIGNANGVHFEMNLSDDVMLKSYKINIHNNFDHHGHTTSKAAEEGETVAFTFDRSYDVSGLKNTTVHHHDIVIPANAAPGDYHLMVWCTDEAGNQSEVARNIVLSTEGGSEHEHE